MGHIGKRCLIAGSGMAGLFAARMVCEHFDEVLLCDRDDVPDRPVTRAGLPQGHHFHALLPGGLTFAKTYFPGITDDLDAGGALRNTGGLDFYFYQVEGKSYALDRYVPQPWTGEVGYVQTRALLEGTVRRRVEALPNVTVRYRTMVRDPVVRDARIRGAVLESPAGSESVTADLVIDATGKAGRTLQWLDGMHLPKPAESVVNCDFAYTSVFLEPADWDAFEGVGFFVAANPQSEHPTRGGALVKMENGRWLATLAARFGDFPPKAFADMREWAKTLNWPVLADLIADAKPVSAPAHFRFPRSIRRHFERLETFPDGLLPIGDTICHYNPTYGQGMSAAARQAQGLAGLLTTRADGSVEGLARAFFPIAYEETRAPWLMAALSDFAIAGTTGDFPAHEQAAIDMLAFLSARAAEDPEAKATIENVAMMRAPLSDLTSPQWCERRAQALATAGASA
jgi:2-polyprenyl-6-methoxyphenol hydroxylase-like FAD-dependent oxidoreductase